MHAFESKTIGEIEAQIEKDVNIRDAMNVDLLALNEIRDRKIKAGEKAEAIAEFQRKHGEAPTQTIAAESVSAGAQPQGVGGLGGLFAKVFGMK